MPKYFKCLCILVVFVTITIFKGNCINTDKKCVQESSCLCRISEYNKIINISSVVDKDTFLNDTSGNVTYYFSGCKDKLFQKTINNTTISFTSSLIKHNASDSVTNYTSIGKASSIKFELAPNKSEDYQLVYDQIGGKTPTVWLICNSFEKSVIKIIDSENDVIVLFSPKVCPILEPDEPDGLSAGSIFLLIFFVTSGIYFFGGALLLYFIRGARGLEIIPNIDFWKTLPGLVKDGSIFLLSGCKPAFVSTAETYDRI